MAITTQDIQATADKIKADGGNPTLAAVRKALGGGSFTTISDAMQEWKAKQHAQTAAPIREAAPASVSERLTAFGSEIWSVALEMANARLQSEREALDVARQEMEATQQEAIGLADQLTEELEQAQATIEQQTQAITKAEAEVADKALAFERERAEREKAERRAETSTAALTETHEQIKALNAQINELKAENKELSKTLNDSHKEAVDFKSQLDITMERLNTSKAELATEKTQSASALIEKDELIKALTSKLETAQTKASESALTASALQGKVEVLEKQVATQEALFDLINNKKPTKSKE
jgi:DNA repair exonuclease SbcCD ATPase subunit